MKEVIKENDGSSSAFGAKLRKLNDTGKVKFLLYFFTVLPEESPGLF